MMRILACVFALVSAPVWAQMVEVTEDPAPQTGKEKAGGYFQDRKAAKPTAVASDSSSDAGSAPRYLALRVGTYFTGEGYGWGHGDQSNIGKLNAGLDYRIGEWINSADLAMRIDYTNFSLDEGSARKLSIGAIVTFPDANSRFPLYFGAGLGAGFFLKQIRKESAVALDYSLIAGARFLNVIDQVGFLVETGMKNHLHLFSDGQFNGIYINVGTVFAF
ncbi:MAG: hypothetical protein KF799_16255 [Bdellovibrionales bacterium]|nr:hypothetical protein [Bdellovibrionales bacterium]